MGTGVSKTQYPPNVPLVDQTDDKWRLNQLTTMVGKTDCDLLEIYLT